MNNGSTALSEIVKGLGEYLISTEDETRLKGEKSIAPSSSPGLTFLSNIVQVITPTRINRPASQSSSLQLADVQLKRSPRSSWRSSMISTRFRSLSRPSQCCHSSTPSTMRLRSTSIKRNYERLSARMTAYNQPSGAGQLEILRASYQTFSVHLTRLFAGLAS